MTNKKKKILAISLVFVLLLVVAAVVVYFVFFRNNVYDKMNKAIAESYNNVTLEVKTELDGKTLTSTFNIKKSGNKHIIEYTKESFPQLQLGQEPSDEKEIFHGTVEVKNGVVTHVSGDQLPYVNFSKMTSVRLHFAKNLFDDAKDSNGEFTAKVKNPRSFMDAPALECSKMNIKFAYKSSPKVLTISYVSAGGANVTMKYTMK